MPVNGVAMVQYRVTNQSSKPHTLIMQPIPGITQITTGLSVCSAPFVLSGKSSCILSLEINGSQLSGPLTDGPVVCQQGNLNQCYRPSAANILRVTVTPVSMVTLSVNPTTLLFAENSTGDVTVTNNADSPVAAENVVATIPGASSISVQSTTCTASLAIGASCTITFASGTQEGPTSISLAGDNTNTVNVDVTVTSQPQISISNPVQQNRVVTVSSVTPLSLEITNSVGSPVNANAITVSDKAGCPNLSFDDSNCASVAPGATCTLELTSNTPYAPCNITVSGSNTANSSQALIAFSYLGGLVFQVSGGIGKVVTEPLENPNELLSLWSTQANNIPTDLDNGAQNTTNIINDDPGCTLNNCAALSCRQIGAEWYLPARDELSSVYSGLCSNGAIPCNFGEFSSVLYWSSSQVSDGVGVRCVDFSSGIVSNVTKFNSLRVRCVRAFTP